ncbi:beta-ketoacyl synthase [Aspergillus granulosus]|uniref:Beta-ketoacyl synthase n=1 Tax=Aspergillus granulosus TaxID=176169 RepID=A0ABR4HMK0_9EURO
MPQRQRNSGICLCSGNAPPLNISVDGGHFITEDLGNFDPAFFSLTATEAEGMDPQQRMALEVSYQALKNAGLSLDSVSETKTCVFSGCSANDSGTMHSKDPQAEGKYVAYSQAMCMIANRISWAFNLRGPSSNIDTACSSSLVALDTACHGALRRRWYGIALGINLIIAREWSSSLDNLGFFSPGNRCFSFGDQANGYSRGEGLSAVDGHTPGITQPSRTAQQKLIQDTYPHAGISPASTRYFEARVRLLGIRRRGSVKSNIGHLGGGSGIAGVIKVILALEKGVIPPVSDCYKRLNSRIDAEYLNIQLHVRSCPRLSPGRQGSAEHRGIEGSHCTAIDSAVILSTLQGTSDETVVSNGHLNGHSNGVTAYGDIDGHQNGSSEVATANGHSNGASNGTSNDTANHANCTLPNGRTHHPWRTFALAQHATPGKDVVESWSTPVRFIAGPTVGLVFTGQGAQWQTMGRELLARYPVYQQSISEASAYLRTLGVEWDLLEVLQADKGIYPIDEPEFTQPLYTAIQIILLDLLESFNLSPNVIVGHSSGEIGAAYCYGGSVGNYVTNELLAKLCRPTPKTYTVGPATEAQ